MAVVVSIPRPVAPSRAKVLILSVLFPAVRVLSKTLAVIGGLMMLPGLVVAVLGVSLDQGWFYTHDSTFETRSPWWRKLLYE